ncbi:hypothetical protein ACLIJS_07810 [Mammaliicoccus sciuri]|uniref:hypothetical protein n=1 Tax=Mammaliicoccus sciuri TaxID=1296 RepID=UPI003A8CFB5A
MYEHPEDTNDFSWINEKDKINKKSKSVHWGIPNHILGDIDNAKVIIGLFNPGTHMNESSSEKCSTVGEYIQNEVSIEKDIIPGVEFDSKEIYEKNTIKILIFMTFTIIIFCLKKMSFLKS